MEQAVISDSVLDNVQDDLQPEYDIKSLHVRKTGRGRQSSGNTVTLDPDVAAVFDTPEAVNAALRFLIKVTKDNAPAALPGT